MRVLFPVLLIIALATSCVSQKEVTYFQAADLNKDSGQVAVQEKYIRQLQPGDILSILVSSLSPEASAMFNPYQMGNNMNMQQQTTQSTAPTPATGFLIDEEGAITLPLVGKIKLAGLTTGEAGTLLTKSLDKYLQQPTVNVRIINFKVSVLGEVTRPSVYTIPNETITLPEALGLAGDLTIYGKRNNILVIRETEGKRSFNRVDLTKRDFFNSPYYYLHANDVIYVEPTAGRITSTDRAVQLAPVVLSGLSIVAVILTAFLR
ncbi:polysaccharide biosynthesis/export family protein [Adhaeribacter sp. BT258]|uniref:Polysaccharide biosynthesis/export family protein n=1 Tax=Adhaeribacter terrigena TaxID=2793070 RepID=A0ABS1C3X7_9BACT|nr:polysaccharide biosynthesis/export family protein [Adhaeribacter terrigena]MBK0404101.1 polysaccharide biosynthesis/export family protein [Adhaeribacter terrigena]